MARRPIDYSGLNGGNSNSGSSSSGGTSSKSSAGNPTGTYTQGDKYVGGNTFKSSSGNLYDVSGLFTSPSGKQSEISNGQVTTTSSKNAGGLMEQNAYLAKLQASADAAARAREAKTAQAVSALEGNRSTIEKNAEEAARQVYISKMQTQKNLAQQLKANGYSGGLSDTAVLRMNTDFANSKDKVMQQKMAALNDLNSQVAQVKASGDISAAQSESEWQQKMAELQYNLQREAAAQQATTARTQATGGATATTNKPRLTYAQALEQINAGNGSDIVLEAADYYGLTPSISNQNSPAIATNTAGTGWVAVNGIGRITRSELANYIQSGQVVGIRNADGSITYRVV